MPPSLEIDPLYASATVPDVDDAYEGDHADDDPEGFPRRYRAYPGFADA